MNELRKINSGLEKGHNLNEEYRSNSNGNAMMEAWYWLAEDFDEDYDTFEEDWDDIKRKFSDIADDTFRTGFGRKQYVATVTDKGEIDDDNRPKKTYKTFKHKSDMDDYVDSKNDRYNRLLRGYEKSGDADMVKYMKQNSVTARGSLEDKDYIDKQKEARQDRIKKIQRDKEKAEWERRDRLEKEAQKEREWRAKEYELKRKYPSLYGDKKDKEEDDWFSRRNRPSYASEENGWVNTPPWW